MCRETFKPEQLAQKFCGQVCKQRWFSINRKHGKSRIRKLLVAQVGKCESCGEADQRSLHAHHINGHAHQDLMVLCANCHYKYHHIMGQTVFAETRAKTDVLQVLQTSVPVNA